MLYVEVDNTIRLTRGDTAYLEIPIVNDITKEEYVISPDDTLTFSVKRSVKDTNVCFSKTIRGANIIHITPDDTRQCEFGSTNTMFNLLLQKATFTPLSSLLALKSFRR